ncbi:recombinase RecT [Singulisphaera sp. Ch08]|uniref:Recombinase RecT n=1 Tax=Singulisphaera sp. Ch08 TaxID=3120278 RepID=A0AAU7CL09_9BACT
MPSANLPAIMPGQAIDFGHLSDETAICLSGAGREYRMTARDVIKWVAPAAPVSEAVKLLVVAQNVNLNPMLKEIELLEIKGTWHIYVRKQGLIKVAQRFPEYDGHETGVVVQIKDLSQPPIDIAGAITPRGFLLQGGWAKVYRKGWSRPVYKRCALQNYAKDKGIWVDNPAVMIEKVAFAQALRESFPIGEVYDESELPGVEREIALSIEDASTNHPANRNPVPSFFQMAPAPLLPVVQAPIVPEYTPPTATEPAVPVLPEPEAIDVEAAEVEPYKQPCTEEHRAKLAELVAKVGMNEATYNKVVLEKRGVQSAEQLTCEQAGELIRNLGEILEKKKGPPF